MFRRSSPSTAVKSNDGRAASALFEEDAGYYLECVGGGDGAGGSRRPSTAAAAVAVAKRKGHRRGTGDRRRWGGCGGGVLLAAAIFALHVATDPMLQLSTAAQDGTRSAVSNDAGIGSNTLPGPPDEEKECTVWIAPSSLRGVDGYGIFTTRDIEAGESVLGAPDGVSIPVESNRYGGELKARERRMFRNLFDNYWWGRGVADQTAYEAPPGVMDYQIGFGCLPNSHCVFDYLQIRYPDPPYIDSMVNRFEHPSAGSFSYNRGREFTLSHSLEAGSEIFLNYGWCSRNARAPSWTDNLYVTDDYEQAAELIRGYYESKIRGGNFGKLKYDTAGKLVVPEGTSRHVKELLPPSEEALLEMVHGIRNHEEMVRQVALNSLNRQTPERIKANGMCMDNLIARKSTLPLAGQGGFAQRTIRRGEVVAPAPLMQIIDKDALILYDRNQRPIGTQLLANYCFGHSATTMLLCPNTNAVLINHCSTRTKDCGPGRPNAAIRWSSGWDPSSEVWRKMSIDEIANQTGRGLSFEVYALRHISPGEEVFIDYGEEWELAWNKHVSTWQPPFFPSNAVFRWITAEEANSAGGPIIEDLVAGDLRKTTDDHPYLFTGCQYWPTGADIHEVYLKLRDWEHLTDERILAYYSDSGRYYFQHQRKRLLDYSTHRDGTYWPCSVIRQDDDDGLRYTVRIHIAPWVRKPLPPWHDNRLPRLLTNYSREQIHYFVKPFKSDQHLPNVFRHPLGIPDEMLPPQWRNK